MLEMGFFDLDGTLVDSGPPIIDSLNDALDRHGLDPVPHDHAHVYIGPPLYDTITAQARAEGAVAVRLYVHSSNDRARTAYERLGMHDESYRVMGSSLRGKSG